MPRPRNSSIIEPTSVLQEPVPPPGHVIQEPYKTAMISLMLISSNQREAQILTTAFEQLSIKTILTTPEYANYVKALQYLPDALIIEMPHLHTQHLRFVRMLRQHKRARRIPVIGYGEKTDAAIVRAMNKAGVGHYLERPLKFSQLLQAIKSKLAQQNKTLEDVSERRKSDKEADISQILDPSTLPVKKIELMVKHIAGLMAFPFTVAKVLHLADNAKSGAADLAKVLETDPVIATNLLKVANTVFFASVNRRISSIRDAIVRVGFRETKRIVMSMSVMSLFDSDSNNAGFDRIAFWRHSLGTGLAAENLAKKIGSVNPEEAFLAGLLHDFGIILLDEFFPEILREALNASTNTAGRFIEEEKRLLGITHCDVVKELFEIWKLPSAISDAAAGHCAAIEQGGSVQSIDDRLALCAGLGNILAKAFACGASCDQFIPRIRGKALQSARLTHMIAMNMYARISQDMQYYRQFLNIEIEESVDSADQSGNHILFVNLSEIDFAPVRVYLQATGRNLTAMRHIDNLAEVDGKYNCIVVLTSEKTRESDLEPLLHIVRHSPTDHHTKKLSCAPLLIIGDNEFAGIQSSQLIFKIQPALDLRALDLKVEEMFEAESGISCE